MSVDSVPPAVSGELTSVHWLDGGHRYDQRTMVPPD
jgi:hypothetical protein